MGELHPVVQVLFFHTASSWIFARHLAMSDKKEDRTVKDGDRPRKKKESILDLTKYLEKSITVSFARGRQVTGILKGYDGLVNIVLDEAVEKMRDPEDEQKLSGETRHLGLTVCRGPQVVVIAPTDGMEQ